MVTCGAITDFIYNKVASEEELMKKDFIDFTKIKFVEANRKNFPDIDKYKLDILIKQCIGSQYLYFRKL